MTALGQILHALAGSPLAMILTLVMLGQLGLVVKALLPARKRRHAAAGDVGLSASRRAAGVPYVSPMPARRMRREEPGRVNIEQQFHRVGDIVERATRSAETAVRSHLTASRHIDSAEYQLLRLLEEFPALRTMRGATA